VAEWDYQRLVEEAWADDRVVGLVLTGSRGRGPFARDDSDWDVRLVVADQAVADSRAVYGTKRGAVVETVVLSVAEFEAAGEIGSLTEWDRYSYTHARAVVDKLGGRITELVAAKGVLPPDTARKVATAKLDEYINSYYRSAKNVRDGRMVEAHLDAAESVAPFLTALFAMHERVRPFNKFLLWELEEFPLSHAVWRAGILLSRLERVIGTGELEAQQQLFREAERLARECGLGGVIDGWQPHVQWLRGK
jgi:hypothetical protein